MMRKLILIAITMLSMVVATAALAEEGMASYYADSIQGNSTASGEPYNKEDLTAAHRTLEFGSRVKVTNLDNGQSVIVRINDRGPHSKNRIIDLSGAAAAKLGMQDSGTANVSLEPL